MQARSFDALFWGSAIAALCLHAILLFAPEGLQGGADLKPHLRLIQQMGESPALRTIYAPAYHVLGAVLAPVVGLADYPRWFALLSAVALIAGFRSFQRAAGLPSVSAALFAWAPYGFALSWCLPKVEAAGYGLAFLGLSLVLKQRYVALAGVLVATFTVHTAAGLLLGLGAGVLALAQRDPRALAALAVGTLFSAPLFAAHLAAGCSAAEAFLFSQGDYLRRGPRTLSAVDWLRFAALAGPVAVVAALAGVGELWRRWSSISILCGVVVFVCLNELWLAPFGSRTTLDLTRGLTLLAFPIAIAAGVGLFRTPRVAVAAVLACGLWSIGTAFLVVPGSCHVAPIAIDDVEKLRVARCTFRWSAPRQDP